MTRRTRRIEIERIAQAAALEELAAFYAAIQNARVAAEKAASFIGGNTQGRFERVIADVGHALGHLPEISMHEKVVERRAARRLLDPLYELRDRPEPAPAARVAQAEDLALPWVDAIRMRDGGMSWRQIRESMLEEVAS